MTEISGRCECGGVRFQVSGPVRKVVYCHCGQCRRTSGHFVAATACATENLHMIEDGSLHWYQSSEIAERGFCRVCGASIFFRPTHGRHISIMAGVLDAPTGLNAREHIYMDDASDYYEINDGLPQFAGNHEDLWEDNDA